MFDILFKTSSTTDPTPEKALPRRLEEMPITEHHFAPGCSCGAWQLFWRLPGAHVTAVAVDS